ncbi:hypothetical protein ACHAXT_004789 [Thalassiosira profunda]
MKQNDREKELPPCVGSIDTAQYQAMFRAADEKTSTHPNALHYTVWKAMALHPFLAKFQSILISLPFVYGFSNRFWEEMTDYMLEKKPGDRRIHRMRIIGLVCPEFNTALKHFARQFMHNYEASEPSDFQHGARPHRQAQDLAMIKLCTYETSRAGYLPIATTQYDASACFDRLYPEISNLNLLRLTVAKPLLRARAMIISRMRRSVCTGLGVSKRTYEQTPRGPRLTGKIQGKADVPIAYANTTDGILRGAHWNLAPRLKLPSPSMERSIEQSSLAYFDDTDGHVSAPPLAAREVEPLVCKLERSAQIWNELENWTGGSVAFHKTNWQFLAWELVKGRLQLIYETDEELVMKVEKGEWR